MNSTKTNLMDRVERTQHFTPDEIHARLRSLGKWFHNINLNGVWTAPDHFLGNYPEVKWRKFAHAIPENLEGKTVLDIGCNGGFYSIEMKRRGAKRVVAIDSDERYLNQARFAAEVLETDIEFQNLSVYEIAQLGGKFDLVIFMGVLYHLRHPLLALDLIREHAAKDLFLFQSMQRGSDEIDELKSDYPFEEAKIFEQPGFPKMYFIEKKFANDQTNWWIPNRACTEAMLRSAGFEIVTRAEDEVYVCRIMEKEAMDEHGYSKL